MRTFKKKPYFECDLGPRGQGILRQTQLSFSKTPTTPARTGEEHDRAGLSNFLNFSSTTVGQHGRPGNSAKCFRELICFYKKKSAKRENILV